MVEGGERRGTAVGAAPRDPGTPFVRLFRRLAEAGTGAARVVPGGLRQPLAPSAARRAAVRVRELRRRSRRPRLVRRARPYGRLRRQRVRRTRSLALPALPLRRREEVRPSMAPASRSSIVSLGSTVTSSRSSTSSKPRSESSPVRALASCRELTRTRGAGDVRRSTGRRCRAGGRHRPTRRPTRRASRAVSTSAPSRTRRALSPIGVTFDPHSNGSHSRAVCRPTRKSG